MWLRWRLMEPSKVATILSQGGSLRGRSGPEWKSGAWTGVLEKSLFWQTYSTPWVKLNSCLNYFKFNRPNLLDANALNFNFEFKICLSHPPLQLGLIGWLNHCSHVATFVDQPSSANVPNPFKSAAPSKTNHEVCSECFKQIHFRLTQPDHWLHNYGSPPSSNVISVGQPSSILCQLKSQPDILSRYFSREITHSLKPLLQTQGALNSRSATLCFWPVSGCRQQWL